jgi:methyl-accepting chemotaxis protein
MQRKDPPKVVTPNTPLAKNETVDDVIEDSLRSARNSLAMLHGTREVAAETLQELDKQGQQIDHIQGDVDKILHKEAIAKRQTKSIASIWGSFCNWFKPAPVVPDHLIKIPDKAPDKKSGPVKQQNSNPGTLFAGDIVDTSKMKEESVDKIRQTDDLLDQMGSYVSDLHAMAKDMGAELDAQNKQLEVLTDTTDDANLNMKALTRETRRLTERLK